MHEVIVVGILAAIISIAGAIIGYTRYVKTIIDEKLDSHNMSEIAHQHIRDQLAKIEEILSEARGDILKNQQVIIGKLDKLAKERP